MNTWRKIEVALAAGAMALVGTVLLRPTAPPPPPAMVRAVTATATPGTPRPTVTRQPTLTATPAPPTPTPWPTPTPSPVPPVPRALQGEAPDGRWVVMLAQKTAGSAEVHVVERSYPGGETRPVFAYGERHKASDSGNFWAGRPPSAALSPDGTLLAYADATGLRVRELASAAQRDLIVQTAPARAFYERPGWNVEFPFAIYGFTDPVWSADGLSLSVAALPGEGRGTSSWI